MPYQAWRISYYGWLLPNTFYAKVGSGVEQWWRGLAYLDRFADRHAAFAFPFALALYARWQRGLAYLGRFADRFDAFAFSSALKLLARRRVEPWAAYLLLLVAAYAGFIVAVGGDGLLLFRFCVHVAPLAYLLVQEGAASLARGARRVLPRALHALPALAGWAFAGLALYQTAYQTRAVLVTPERWYEPQCELSFPGNGEDHDHLFFGDYFVERLTVAARWLETNAPPGSLVASTPAGAIAYNMGHPVIDMLGLNDEHIAHVDVEGMGGGRAGHEKGDGAYVLSRRPDYVLLGNVAVLPRPILLGEFEGKLVRRSEHELWFHPEFRRDYELVHVRLADEGLFQVFSFFRRKATAPPREE